jgi:hypothetical protein
LFEEQSMKTFLPVAAFLMVVAAAAARAQEPPAERDPFGPDAAPDATAPAPPAKAAAPPMARKALPAPDKRAAVERINAALGEETAIECIEFPLAELVEYLEDLHKIPIEIDTKALDEAGLGSDVPVTRNLKGITLDSALTLLLKELELTYVVDNEVLLITTPEHADELPCVILYPIGPLTKAGWDVKALQSVIKRDTGGESDRLGEYLAVSQSQPAHRKTAQLMQKLVATAEKDLAEKGE